MLLNDGIATVYALRDASGPGEAPRYERAVRVKSYYAEISFETSPTNPTGKRNEHRIDARVRIQQCRKIREDDEAMLESFHEREKSGKMYKIVRAYHGTDDESGLPISDLSLEEVSKR